MQVKIAFSPCAISSRNNSVVYCVRKQRLLFFTLFLFSLSGFAQTTITGLVKNTDGLPLSGVSVRAKNTSANGTVTNNSGAYSIVVQPNEKTLVFSFVGYTTQEISIGGRKTINLTMDVNNTGMDEVIVTGYTTTTRKDLTGAVGSVKMEELQKAPVRSFEEALAGRVAGVQVTSQSGRPGSGIDIVIRGVGSISQSNRPLFVIDGFPIENPDNNILDPNDIESINVLKDASSTALYGAKGSNGVVVITTKRGTRGTPVIGYNASYGINKPIKYLKLLSPYEFVKVQSEYLGANNPYLNNGAVLEDYRNVKGVDWQGRLLQTGSQQNHSLSLRGGAGGTLYSFSGNYFNQEGIIINSAFRRYQGKLTLDQTVGTRLKVSAAVTYTNNKIAGQDPQGTSGGGNALFYHAFTYRPISISGFDDQLEASLYDPEGNGVQDYRVNPILSTKNEIRNNISSNIISNLSVDYSITKQLKLRVRGSANNTFMRVESFNGSKTRLGGPYSTSGINGSLYNYQYDYFDNTNLLDYTNTFGKKHRFNLVVGNSIQMAQSRSFGYSAYQIPSEELGISGIDAGIINTPPTGSISKSTLASLLGSFAYNYAGKYYLTGNFRADGSSKFVGDNKWSYFPSGAVKWKFTEEKFLKKNKILSDGNIRGSYGITGNNRIGDFDTYARISFSSPFTYNGVTQPNSAVIGSLQNPSLKWENTTATDLGVDLGFFDNRLNLVVDVYKRTTKNLLYRTQLPTSTGYGSVLKNIAAISNRGLEISLNAAVINKGDFSYNSNFNISFNRNRLEALSDPDENAITTSVSWEAVYATTPAYIAKIGGPLGQMYGLVADGLYQYSDFDRLPNGTYALKPNIAVSGTPQPGDQKFIDINHDGKINADDRVVIGNGYPLHTGGWSNSLRYKNFDVNIFLQWSYGNSVIDANRIWFATGMGIQQRGSFIPAQNTFAEFANRWTAANQDTDIPKLNRVAAGVYSSQFVEDGSFLRLKTINIGYNLPAKLLLRHKIKGLRVYVATSNIYTWTKYKGYDPELSAYQTALTPGLDYSTYPRPFTIVGGLNLSF
ncbi:TonB-dependent receptor [Flavisolibacter ginsenosidimutans]|uniref:TonB-dependent receptor n=1 Tax=Flavisolibacter ginsenosidimutans TaxID=661481 RepID=A0A5B8UCT9_9BACT|nr:TonB-dependent receptor [Flavisolibacter ginsenosidimutans]